LKASTERAPAGFASLHPPYASTIESTVSFPHKRESREYMLWIPYQARNDILHSHCDTTPVDWLVEYAFIQQPDELLVAHAQDLLVDVLVVLP
jgi:hypothetical protein